MYRLEVLAWQNAGGEGQKPERIPVPRPAAELRAEQQEKQDRLAHKARRHAERQRKRAATT